ncbi:hypothetical protein ACFYNW_35915 [Streptomyces virginiae]
MIEPSGPVMIDPADRPVAALVRGSVRAAAGGYLAKPRRGRSARR